MPKSEKIIRCPVHGYITIPRNLLTSFVDTPIFQRLRDISQTSLRPLFPSAQHTRYSHSIGTYHIAEAAFSALVKNTSTRLVDKPLLESYRATFLVAALLHDCAHAPFSHGLEAYYNSQNYATDTLLRLVRDLDGTFRSDYDFRKGTLGCFPAPHEMFSSVVFLKFFKDQYESLVRRDRTSSRPDSALVVRMITGCLHRAAETPEKQVENCLIKLINGRAIDVDKLDYVMRDMWAVGVDKTPFDLQRLLSALHIGRQRAQLEPAFHKSALSVIESVVDRRNFIYRWLYSHHTVVYFTELLDNSVKRLMGLLATGGLTPLQVRQKLFRTEIFRRTVSVGPFRLHLPSDGDIRFLLKHFKSKIPEMQELLSRMPKKVPLWKSTAEFDHVFSELDPGQIPTVKSNAKRIVESAIGVPQAEIMVLDASPKLVNLDMNDVLVSIGGKLRSFDKAVPYVKKLTSVVPGDRFYVYIPTSHKSARNRQKAAKALSKGNAYA